MLTGMLGPRSLLAFLERTGAAILGSPGAPASRPWEEARRGFNAEKMGPRIREKGLETSSR